MNEIRVGLLGLGTIGTGVARILLQQQEIMARRTGRKLVLAAVCDRKLVHEPEADLGVDLTGVQLYHDAEEMMRAPKIDLVVELIGGYEPARSFVVEAIRHGKHVVTANKALIAKHGEELFALAAEQGTAIGFEAAVGGGIPCLKALREGLAANNITAIFGILNGTCNYILTRMENEGAPYDQVLRDAQRLGYAEADPTFDVEGVDTAHKLAILAAMAYGCTIRFDEVYTSGISRITPEDIASARELGFRIKLLGIARPHGDAVEMRVHPTLVPLDAQIAQVADSYNAVMISGDFVEHTMYYGRGAGERPTASAVVADILDIARAMPDGIAHLPPPMGFIADQRRTLATVPMEEIESEYYLRLMVADRPGVIAAVSRILAEHDISLEAVIQKARHATEAVPVVLRTHRIREGNLNAAIRRIEALECVAGEAMTLRIERFGA
ncbi:MAG: homoserine dehydrogenase [Zetaproteobacteria bacterium]|nr:MAG: homoserine dehydrogenase [Zetaproteobacteria bacterium]